MLGKEEGGGGLGKEMTVADESCSGCTNSAGFRKRGGQTCCWCHSTRRLGVGGAWCEREGARAPRSPRPSHAHACRPAVNTPPLTTGSHLAPASAPTPEPGKTHSRGAKP